MRAYVFAVAGAPAGKACLLFSFEGVAAHSGCPVADPVGYYIALKEHLHNCRAVQPLCVDDSKRLVVIQQALKDSVCIIFWRYREDGTYYSGAGRRNVVG